MASIQIDATTCALGLLAVVLVVVGLRLRSPPPLAHPFVLGRQSIAARTRKQGQSPVYTTSSLGGVRPPQRPDKRVRTLANIVQDSATCFERAQRGTFLPTTYVTNSHKLKDIVEQLRVGLGNALGSQPVNVALLVQDPTDTLLLTLALALSPHDVVVISPDSNIPSQGFEPAQVIIHSSDRTTEADNVPRSISATKLISIGTPEQPSAEAQEWIETGKTIIADGKASAVPEQQPADVALTMVSEGIALKLTHLNLTSALVAWGSMFPASSGSTKPTIKDTAMTLHHPATPYGFGLSLYLIYCSSSIDLPTLPPKATHDEMFQLLDVPPLISLLFAPVEPTSELLYKLFLTNMLGDFANIIRYGRDAKQKLLRQGVLRNDTFWDKILFNGVRKDSRAIKLRFLALEGQSEQARLESFRTILGQPVVSTKSHAFLLSPLTSGMMFDLQRLPRPGTDEADLRETAHVGAPVAGIEIKIMGKEDDIERGRVRGELLVRSPLLPSPSTIPSPLLLEDDELPQLPPYPGVASTDTDGAKWLRTGIKGEIAPEGVLWLEDEDD
ncbi:hypothetical protein OIO90_000171 [Microbotryomycetes sp. JL221]|nr:hypothetical protein OIO90_000171 [Microbotryomycetes sp. JL221]